MLVPGRGLEDLRDRVEARAARHVEVEHEHVGLVAARRADRGLDVADRGDDLEAVLGLEQQLAGRGARPRGRRRARS